MIRLRDLVLLLLAAEVHSSPGQAAELQSSKTPPAASTNEVGRRVELRGRVIRVPEQMRARSETNLPAKHDHVWGFKTTNGAVYTLVRGRYSEAIWLDERIRAKELLLRGQIFPQRQAFEVQNLKSIRDGVVQDLYYFCNVCIIQSVSPEICACCQAPVVLVERPLKAGNE